MIELRNVTKEYIIGDGLFRAIDDLSIRIKDAQFVAITGKSGSGKSTLLNLIGTLDRPTKGEIIIHDRNVDSFSSKEVAQFRNKELGFVFQQFNLEGEYTVYENIEVPLIISGLFGKENLEEILDVLKIVDLLNKKDVKAKKLSGGEQQRVTIARAIINNPSIILADEPTGNLDKTNAKIVLDLLTYLHTLGKTIVLVTHDEETTKIADRVITLSDGKVVKDEENTVVNR
ncbi:MAG: ABC transporter ATP-binding protein [Candidatus Izemoplasmatales bacterium]